MRIIWQKKALIVCCAAYQEDSGEEYISQAKGLFTSSVFQPVILPTNNAAFNTQNGLQIHSVQRAVLFFKNVTCEQSLTLYWTKRVYATKPQVSVAADYQAKKNCFKNLSTFINSACFCNICILTRMVIFCY